MNRINIIVEKQRSYFDEGLTKDLSFRLDSLKGLKKVIVSNEELRYPPFKNKLNLLKKFMK